jgi:hypothetical protein
MGMSTSGEKVRTERVKVGEYGGYILYSCMKIEQRNLFKLSYEWGREIRKNDVEGKSN